MLIGAPPRTDSSRGRAGIAEPRAGGPLDPGHLRPEAAEQSPGARGATRRLVAGRGHRSVVSDEPGGTRKPMLDEVGEHERLVAERHDPPLARRRGRRGSGRCAPDRGGARAAEPARRRRTCSPRACSTRPTRMSRRCSPKLSAIRSRKNVSECRRTASSSEPGPAITPRRSICRSARSTGSSYASRMRERIEVSMLREISMKTLRNCVERGVGVLEALLEHRQAVRDAPGRGSRRCAARAGGGAASARRPRSRSRSRGARASSSITRSKRAVPSDSSRNVRPTASKRSSR